MASNPVNLRELLEYQGQFPKTVPAHRIRSLMPVTSLDRILTHVMVPVTEEMQPLTWKLQRKLIDEEGFSHAHRPRTWSKPRTLAERLRDWRIKLRLE